MNKTIGLILILSGCASTEHTTEFYRRFAVKPVVAEHLNNNTKEIIVFNPFNVSVNVDVDCDTEFNHNLIVKPSNKNSFTIASNDPVQTCFIKNWNVK